MAKPVIAVVPHYNQAETLPCTLYSATGQGYDELVILDDASDPEQLEKVRFRADVSDATLIEGEDNRGAAGNRNRIIEAGRYGGALLHFLDADVSLNSRNTADHIRYILDDNNVGIGGGLIRTADPEVNPLLDDDPNSDNFDFTRLFNDSESRQMALNYGPSFTVKAHFGGFTQLRLEKKADTDPEAASRWRKHLDFLVDGWPDPDNIEKAEPFWVAEANMFMPTDTLEEIGGFPPVRHHDIQGPAIETARKGLRTVFEPYIDVTHYPDNEHDGRTLDIAKATWHLIRQYGLTRFVFGGDAAK